MAWTREKLKGSVGTKRVTSEGATVIKSMDISSIPLNPSTANKQKYPGAFNFSELSIAFTVSWTDDANFTTSIMNEQWFRGTDSTTT